jgi:hypothetical protein
MRFDARTLSALLALAAAVALPSAAAAGRGSDGVFGPPQLDPVACTLTVTSSKDVSNYTVDGEKTELGGHTTTLVLAVQANDVVTVKAGTSSLTYTVASDICAPGGGDGGSGGGL